MVHPDEENVRNMMVFAENRCTTMDHALSTITKDELALAAQLSLNIAQKLLDAGQSLFTSLGDEERRKVRAGDRGDRITIEEIEEEQVADTKEGSKVKGGNRRDNGQLKRAAVLRTCLEANSLVEKRQLQAKFDELQAAVTLKLRKQRMKLGSGKN
eukprot:jgi/Phyca11/15431/fgenesh1_pg.PHYCAscaffold_13_\